MHIQTIPLNKLAPSPRNVRKTGGATIEDLAASIAAHGLIQNLTVTAHEDGTFPVEAGDRRRLALALLAEQGKIQPDYPVDCRVCTLEEAGELSLAENTIRQAMHPADEFDAFNRLAADEKLDPAEIAARFGCSPVHVRQRLQLARVHPDLIEQYRANTINLEQLQALAVTDDTAEQLRVWTNARSWERDPRDLRRALTSKELEVGRDPIARFVGVEAYKAAGGEIRQDLFAQKDDAGYMLDPKLARTLAEQKLNKRADQLLREGWSWSEVRFEFDWSDKRKFTELDATYANGKKLPWTAAQKAASGCVVTIESDKVKVHQALVRPEDKKKAIAAKNGATPEGVAAMKSVEPKKKANDELTMSSILRLQAHRTAVLREHVASNHSIALAALAASLWEEGDGNTPDGSVCIIRNNDYGHRPDKIVDEVLEQHPLVKDLAKKREQLELRVTTGAGKGTVLAWLLSEPIETSIEILAHCTAENLLLAQRSEHKGHADEGRGFGQLVGVDFSAGWEVSGEWLEQQPTAYIAKVVTGVCGKKAAAELAKAKGKAAIAAKAWQLIKAADPTWLPAPLIAPKPKSTPVDRKKLQAPAVAV